MSPRDYDVVIRNATIIDGTGKKALKGSIGLKDEKIAAIMNSHAEASSGKEIDAGGLVAAPGFIDMHSHADITALQYPLAENLVMQGVTTFVGGNCGYSMAPLGEQPPLMPPGPVLAARWWREVEPDTYGPPEFLRVDKYGEILKERLGFAVDWRSFNEFLSKVEKMGTSVNYVPLVGHNTVRLAVMGEDFKRTAKPTEIEEMRKHVEEAMASGAFGLSSGLDYNPGRFSATEEVIELAKVAQRHGGLYFTHWRHVNNGYLDDGSVRAGSYEEATVGRYRGLMEAIEVCRKANIPLQLSHINPAYIINQPGPEFLREAAVRATLEIVDKANEEGLDVTFDLIPNENGGTMSMSRLIGLFASWLAIFGSKERLLENLKIRQFRDQLKAVIASGTMMFLMINPKTDPYWANHIRILTCSNREYEGRTIGEIARSKNANPIDMIFDVLLEDSDTRIIPTDLRLEDARFFLKHPAAMLGSDILSIDTKFQTDYPLPAFILPHPNTYGLYPRYLRRFVKEDAIISLEEAIKKATYLPAQRLGLKDRGIIAEGAYADMVLFNFEKIRDKGTWLEPRQAPEGIEYVLVNGKIVYENMTHTDLRPGKVFRKGRT